MNLYAGIGGGVGALLLIVLIIVIAVIISKRKKKVEEVTTEKTSNMELNNYTLSMDPDQTHYAPVGAPNTQRPKSGVHLVEDLSQDEKYDILSSELVVQNQLGSGAYGRSAKCLINAFRISVSWIMERNKRKVSLSLLLMFAVAIKMLKTNDENANQIEEFIGEMNLMKYVDNWHCSNLE